MANSSFYGGTIPTVDVSSIADSVAAAAASAAAADAAAAEAVAAVVDMVPNVRQIIAGAGLTGGGNLSADRTLSLATIADKNFLANIAGSTAAPVANTLTAILDAILGQTRGMTLRRGSSLWQALALGTSGQVLKSDGTDVAWADTINVVKARKFTASATYTPPTGFMYGLYFLLGGGAGGGASVGNASYLLIGGGGGSGGLAIGVLTAAQIGASQTLTIGAKGNGGAAGANAGSSGGNSSLGSLLIANGGTGGEYASTVHGPTGGPGGTAGTGDITTAGNPGMSGFYSSAGAATYMVSGQGASSFFAGGPPGTLAGSGSAATGASAAAGAYGAGGSGGCATTVGSNAAGGNGHDAVMFAVEFCKV